jgi:hypothetical protein
MNWLDYLFDTAADGQRLIRKGQKWPDSCRRLARDDPVALDDLFGTAIDNCAGLMRGGEVKYSVTGPKLKQVQYLLDKHDINVPDNFPVECFLRMWHVEQIKKAGIQIFVVNPHDCAAADLTVELLGPSHESIIGNCIGNGFQWMQIGKFHAGVIERGSHMDQSRMAEPSHPNRWRSAHAIYGDITGEPVYIANEAMLAHLIEWDHQYSKNKCPKRRRIVRSSQYSPRSLSVRSPQYSPRSPIARSPQHSPRSPQYSPRSPSPGPCRHD